MYLLDISFFFFAKTICTSKSKWMSNYSYSHSNMLEALPLLYCYSHHTLWKNVCPVLSTGHCEFVWVLCAQSCLTICDLIDWSLPDFPVCGIFQARILEWVAISYSRGSFWSRDWTPAMAGGFSTTAPPGAFQVDVWKCKLKTCNNV